jgi:hypothetical protein
VRLVLIDGDVLVYWASFGAQRTRYTLHVDGEEPRTFSDAKACTAYIKDRELAPEQYERTSHLDVLDTPAAVACCKNILASVTEALDTRRFTIFLTGREKENFRESIATLAPYKGNRQQEKPVHYQLALDYFLNHPAAMVAEGEEADDLIGCWATRCRGEAVVASIDKDLRQIHGRHYEWNNNARFTITPDQSDLWFWLQMLTGDRADNIPGIKGVGAKTAKNILFPEDTILDRQDRYELVAEQYEKQYGEDWERAMTEIGQLLWIRREPGQMWTPDDYLNNRLTEA